MKPIFRFQSQVCECVEKDQIDVCASEDIYIKKIIEKWNQNFYWNLCTRDFDIESDSKLLSLCEIIIPQTSSLCLWRWSYKEHIHGWLWLNTQFNKNDSGRYLLFIQII